MQALLVVYCECDRRLGQVKIDTADDSDALQEKVNKLITAHRDDCPYYSNKPRVICNKRIKGDYRCMRCGHYEPHLPENCGEETECDVPKGGMCKCVPVEVQP